jgi:type IV pilus assembly protein PilM
VNIGRLNIGKRIFPSEATALRPRLACEITPSGVVAARPGAEESEIVSSFVPFRPGIFTPGLKSPNFADRAALSTAIRSALDEVRLRETKTTVVIPDAAVRVLLLDFDSLPAKAAEALPVIRFRLRKLVPFDVEEAAVSYQLMPDANSKDTLVRTIVAVCPASVRSEYESAVREAGYEPGAVIPSTLAALAAVGSDDSALLVNRNANSVTTAITRRNVLLLHRTLELTEKDLLPEENERLTHEELQQSISVAIAYFEDSLATAPRQLYACGLGGAAELTSLLGNIEIPARDLVPTPTTGAVSSIPAGMLAGVVGALAS